MLALRLRAAIGALAASLCAAPARADGPPAYPPGYTAPYATPLLTYDWTGIYVGGHLGAANSRIEWDYEVVPGTPDAIEHSHTGFVGGGFAGLQKQWSWLVVGAEVGYLWMDQPESTVSSVDPGTTLSSNMRNLLLVSGKFGWAHENMLAYFKGGYASAVVDFRTTGNLVTATSEREHGWTAGAGLEYALWDHVIVGVEYDYVGIGVGSRDQVPSGRSVTDATVDFQSVTARLSFKFGGSRPEEAVPVK